MVSRLWRRAVVAQLQAVEGDAFHKLPMGVEPRFAGGGGGRTAKSFANEPDIRAPRPRFVRQRRQFLRTAGTPPPLRRP